MPHPHHESQLSQLGSKTLSQCAPANDHDETKYTRRHHASASFLSLTTAPLLMHRCTRTSTRTCTRTRAKTSFHGTPRRPRTTHHNDTLRSKTYGLTKSTVTISVSRIHVIPSQEPNNGQFICMAKKTGDAAEEELYIRRNARIESEKKSSSDMNNSRDTEVDQFQFDSNSSASQSEQQRQHKKAKHQNQAEIADPNSLPPLTPNKSSSETSNPLLSNSTNVSSCNASSVNIITDNQIINSSSHKTTIAPSSSTTNTDALNQSHHEDQQRRQNEAQQSTEISKSTTSSVQTTTQTSSSTAPVAMRLLTNPLTPKVMDRIRRESTRFVSTSPLLSSMNVRFPTRRETLTLAGELALVVAVLMLLRAGVSRTLRWIHARLSPTSNPLKRQPSTSISYESSIFECLQRPLEFLSLFTVGTVFIEALSRPLAAKGLLRHIRSLRELGLIIAATWFLLRWIDRIRMRFTTDKRIDQAQVDATARFATVATVVISLLISLDTIGINVQTVLAFGGIGGVAIGFAGREIISNFFGGFMIYVTRPFTVGEWIRCIEEQQLNGTVEDIGWYLTRVRTWDKRPLYIPNSRFSTLIVENGSRMDNRRIVHYLHLRLEDIPVAHSVVAKMEKVLMNHPALDPKQHRLVYIDSFDDYSVKLWFSCYTKSVFLYDFRDVQQELLLKFYDIIRSAGAKLASRNTRDVRPGADTDNFGPFGEMATFGADLPEEAKQSNPDVVAKERRKMTLIDNVPYAAMIQQQETQEKDGSTSDTGRKVAGSNGHINIDDFVGMSSSSGLDDKKTGLSSEAAITAVVGALAAARRIASRRQSDSEQLKASTVAKKGSGTTSTAKETVISNDDTKLPVSSVPASTAPVSGQMMISKAPSAPSAIPPSTPPPMATPAATPPRAVGGGGGSNEGTKEALDENGKSNETTVPSGQMNITKALSSPSSSPPPPVRNATEEVRSGAPSTTSAFGNGATENAVDGGSSGGNGNVVIGVPVGGGQMKISKAASVRDASSSIEGKLPSSLNDGGATASTSTNSPTVNETASQEQKPQQMMISKAASSSELGMAEETLMKISKAAPASGPAPVTSLNGGGASSTTNTSTAGTASGTKLKSNHKSHTKESVDMNTDNAGITERRGSSTTKNISNNINDNTNSNNNNSNNNNHNKNISSKKEEKEK